MSKKEIIENEEEQIPSLRNKEIREDYIDIVKDIDILYEENNKLKERIKLPEPKEENIFAASLTGNKRSYEEKNKIESIQTITSNNIALLKLKTDIIKNTQKAEIDVKKMNQNKDILENVGEGLDYIREIKALHKNNRDTNFQEMDISKLEDVELNQNLLFTINSMNNEIDTDEDGNFINIKTGEAINQELNEDIKIINKIKK